MQIPDLGCGSTSKQPIAGDSVSKGNSYDPKVFGSNWSKSRRMRDRFIIGEERNQSLTKG